MSRPITSERYSFYYTLTREEYNKFIELLETVLDSDYTVFITVLLAELNGDLNALLRVLNIGSSDTKKVLPPLLYSTVLMLIKESIILTDYENFKGTLESISATSLANCERYQFAGIDRNTINRTFKKYNLKSSA